MVARARGCSQECPWRSRELCVCAAISASVIVVLFLMLAVVHCPLALQLADGVSRRQALSLASGAAAAHSYRVAGCVLHPCSYINWKLLVLPDFAG